MSQILSVASRAVRGKSAASKYEDLDGPDKSSSDGGRRGSGGGENMMGQELEMNSVSIVPDGRCPQIEAKAISCPFQWPSRQSR